MAKSQLGQRNLTRPFGQFFSQSKNLVAQLPTQSDNEKFPRSNHTPRQARSKPIGTFPENFPVKLRQAGPIG
jgi:hypothetical protein